MSAATFFGHRNFDYSSSKEKLQEIVVDLIENNGVTLFYNGYRGNFDKLCAEKQCIVDKVDFVISGVLLHSGGAWSACEYARRRNKHIINLFDKL